MSDTNSNSNQNVQSPSSETKENDKENRPKLKILALHGYRQNGTVFRGKIGSFRKAVAKYAQLTFISAPHKVFSEDSSSDEARHIPILPACTTHKCHNPRNPHNLFSPWWNSECESARAERKAAEKIYNKSMTEENFLMYKQVAANFKKLTILKKIQDARSWWFNAEDNTFSGKCLGGPALGFQDTLELVEKIVKEHGPFDGFMGFSQGACLVGLLAAMQHKGYLPYSFKFAIMASGFKSGSLVHKSFYDEEITLPSLHVYGESDSIIPKEMSESLISMFINPVVAEHTGGHYVACSGAIKDAYQDFLHDRYQDFVDDGIAEDRSNSVEEKKTS